MLIATSGHIDHGKTALVRALTGAETDRLPEEQRRGITIDLGFAYWPLGDGVTIGFVDVPGHERYLRNMIAGLCGVEFALLVVAADDGVMPQTVEHLEVLDLLGISRGIVAITKADLVAPARLDAVRDEVADLLAGTGLAGSPIHAVSTVSGAGLDGLSAALRHAAAGTDEGEGARAFRMAVDRVFTVPGAGTVAAGTVLSGSIAREDAVVIAPSGSPARVRGIQSGGLAVERAGAGQRCAINLPGVDMSSLGRGTWLVEPGLGTCTDRIEVRIDLLEGRQDRIKHGGQVHLHIGTADIGARVLLGTAGAQGLATLHCDGPVHAVTGDRFVLRDASARDVLGGGRVLDPEPGRGRAWRTGRAALASAMAEPEPTGALSALLDIPGHELDLSRFARAWHLPLDRAETLAFAAGGERVGRKAAVFMRSERLHSLADAVVAALAAHHAQDSASGGMTARDLRAAAGNALSARPFATLLRRLLDEGRIEQAGPLLRLPGHAPSFAPGEVVLWNRLVAAYEDAPPRAFSLADAARELGASEASTRAMLYRRQVAGDCRAFPGDRFILESHVSAIGAAAASLAEAHPEGFTAAQFRDATGIGRNMVIRLLEFLDATGVTRRVGDARLLRE
ncbi:selenocysteine-specific translation elongation factor [Novosphingobium sp. TH158]|uniref:selenocysteine-specific translation elongation factor n=1 Tax=Novosphingobium sp. TH158 TaxID=2067455 RepID=UPI000C7BCE1E|nr:selenocysteine-specific translation elongation factor [Novosphingobium sp. TH158]PLK27482.1 selenocysteine-specific translation elongation factor [Novosphingobium sp. TH158]